MRRMLVVLTALTAIVAAGVYALFARDLSHARTRLLGGSQTISTSFGTLEYAAVGDGLPMLAVHGAGGGFDQSIDLIGSLADHGFRVIAPSRFGYLGSAMPAEATAAMQADAFAALLDRLSVEKAFVVGISAGAWSATQFAIRHPDRCRALALLVPADYLPEGTSNYGGVLVRAMYGSDFVAWAALRSMQLMPAAMMRAMLGTAPDLLGTAGPADKTRMTQLLGHLLPTSARAEGMKLDIRTATERETYPIQKIACPVLAISARDDLFGTAAKAKAIAAGVPSGKAVIYPSGGHVLVGHYADALNEITAFFGER